MTGEIKRNTVQRQLVLGTLQKMRTHPTVEEVYAEIQKEQPTISKTTIYRNLRQLARSGMIAELYLPHDVERYDGNTHQHYHFKCTACGCVEDLEIDYLDGIDDAVREKHGISIDRHDLVFTGVCSDCS